MSAPAQHRTTGAVTDLFDTPLLALRRDRAARTGTELFLFERSFDDCLERIALTGRSFDHALLLGCPNPRWPDRLRSLAAAVDVRDPGPLFAAAAHGETIDETCWEPAPAIYDLTLAMGTIDTVNHLPLFLALIRESMRPDSLIIGVLSGGDTLPQLRSAMRAADAVLGVAAPHVHPRIEASALSSLLTNAGFVAPVVDIDRVQVSYPSLDRLVSDLRAMGGTNVLKARARPLTRAQRRAASSAFLEAGAGGRTIETFELVHFAAWTPRSS